MTRRAPCRAASARRARRTARLAALSARRQFICTPAILQVDMSCIPRARHGSVALTGKECARHFPGALGTGVTSVGIRSVSEGSPVARYARLSCCKDRLQADEEAVGHLNRVSQDLRGGQIVFFRSAFLGRVP